MDTFPGQCNFPIGESSPFELIGTKYEGNDVSTSEEGATKMLTAIAEDKGGLQINIKTVELPVGSSSVLLSSEPDIAKYKKNSSAVTSTVSDHMLNLPRTSPVTESNSKAVWIEHDTDVPAPPPYHSQYHIDDFNLDDACPTSFVSAENQRETWEVLRTLETTGSDAFDLLSYVCEGEIHSPEGSTSIDSSAIVENSKSFVPLSSAVKIEDLLEEKNEKLERRTTPTISVNSPLATRRRSERTRTTSTSSKVEKVGKSKERNERRGRKRILESDSDDDDTSSTYRESREKNNEASRRSRLNKKVKETEMALKAEQLEKDNRILKMKVEELEKLVTSMRNALLRSALKKEV